MRRAVKSFVVVFGLAGNGSVAATEVGDTAAFPAWNSSALCHASMTARRQDLHFFEDCTERESDAAAQAESLWPGLSQEAKVACSTRAAAPEGGSYRSLLACVRSAGDGGAAQAK